MFNPLGFFSGAFLRIGKYEREIEPLLDLSRVLPIVGYLMFLMTLVDFANILIPLRLQNPEWELTTIDALSNHSWALLISTGFIITGFFGINLRQVRIIELRLLMIIRWGLLSLAALYLLFLLLILTNTNRLIGQIKTNFSQQIEAREQLIGQVEQNLDAITDPNQLMQIGQTLGLSLSSSDPSPEVIQQEIRERLPGLKIQISQQAARAEKSQIRILIKRSIRTTIQLILIIIANCLVWLQTRRLNLLLW